METRRGDPHERCYDMGSTITKTDAGLNTVFSLDVDGQKDLVIVKDVQRHPIMYLVRNGQVQNYERYLEAEKARIRAEIRNLLVGT